MSTEPQCNWTRIKRNYRIIKTIGVGLASEIQQALDEQQRSMIQMLSEKDICLSASRFIAKHGDQAVLQAVVQFHALLAAGDVQGAVVWRTMINAVEVMHAAETVGSIH